MMSDRERSNTNVDRLPTGCLARPPNAEDDERLMTHTPFKTRLELSTPEEKDEDDDDEVEVSEVEVNPTAYIPMLLYTSDVQHGSKLHWLQWPVKYRLLTTSHSNTGRGFQWLLMHFEHIWCYDAVFSTLTRAMEVPGPRTVCPGQPAQASCAAICRASVLSSLPQQATLHIFATARMQSGNLVAQSSGQGSGVQDQERVKTNWTNWAWAKIKCPNAASNSKLLQKI